MKRIISGLIIVLVLMSTLCVLASATNNVYIYNIDGIEYTVEIADENIDESKKQSIANALVNAEISEAVPANIWCDIFGHDYKYTTTNVVRHKVYSTVPRCERKTYDLKYCEDCDYTEQKLIATAYIDCCPVD